MSKSYCSLGLMSGTSMDGIDASIIKSDGEQSVEIVDDMYLKYDDKLRSKLKKTIEACISKEEFKKLYNNIKELEKEITLRHAEVSKLIIEKNKNVKLDIIGFHGQTVLHKPQKGYSIQIGDSQLLSELTKTTVVSNFRENDILNGGQGAPLAPLYHQLILKKIKSKLPSSIINIGGISNITYVKNQKEIISFDTGPGNYLINEWVQSNSKKEFDEGGLISKSGRVNQKVLNELLSNPYYKKKYPKSLDVKDFNLNGVNKLKFEDGCATLSMLTVKSICTAIKSFKEMPNKILFSGGGRKNKFIIENIKNILNKPIYLIDEFNFNGDFIESQTFAYLAIRSYLKKFITFPSTTGVKKSSFGGLVFKI